jgi:hypothetical protein
MLLALILKGKAAIRHLCPAGDHKTARPFFSQYLRRDMRIAMISENQKPSTFVTLTRKRPSYIWVRIIGKPFAVSGFVKEFRSSREGQMAGQGARDYPVQSAQREFGV